MKLCRIFFQKKGRHTVPPLKNIYRVLVSPESFADLMAIFSVIF